MQPLPSQVVLQLVMGSWASQATGTLARLHVFDHVDGKVSTAQIAERVSAAPDALYRLMRVGAMLGLFVESPGKVFALTPVGEVLRTDHPHSMRAFADAQTAPGHWLPWGRLDDCVRHGHSYAEAALGSTVWDFYAKHPAEGRTFSEAMSSMSAMAIGAISEAGWQPPAGKRVVDVGGAHGAFLDFVLGKLPDATGVLFDTANVVETAPTRPRVERLAGDFLTEVPAGDVFLLKHIVHDWNDAQCTKILGNVRRAMSANGRVVIVEMIVPEMGTPSPALLLDLNMLVMLPGRERTVAEMTALCATAGLAVDKVTPTHSPFAVIEARAI